MIKRIGLTLFTLVLAGCSSASSVYLTGEARPAIAQSEVALYDASAQNHSQIAIVSVKHVSILPTDEQKIAEAVERKLKSEAANLGGNGLVILDLEQDLVEVRRTTTFDGNQSIARVVPQLNTTARAAVVYVD